MLMRRLIQTTAALVVAVVAYALVTVPPKRVELQAPIPGTVAVGAYHIHTTRSDGAGTADEVAAAAAKAGLAFAILTDHGDATRVPDPPRYVSGVLLIDAVEVSTTDGHVVALGLAGAAPYPLGGEGRDVIEDIHRLGGFAIVAHPDSPRDELRWRPSGGAGALGFGGGRGGGGAAGGDLAGADGVEWMNADSEWRDDSWPALLHTVLHLPVRPAESFAALMGRPAATMRRWDALTRRRSVTGLSAVDAHGLIAGLYSATFKSFSQGVILDAPLSGDAATDAARVLAALRAGHAFSVITGVASVAAPDLRAVDATREVTIGDRLTQPSGAVTIRASIPGAPGARVSIMHNDRELASGYGRVDVVAPDAGAYRLEAWMGERRGVPWLVTNPVYVDAPSPAAPIAPAPAAPAPTRALPPLPISPITVPLGFGPEWTIEHSPSSTGAVAAFENGVAFTYAVGTASADEFVALARAIGDGTESFDRIEFTATSDVPARVSVQFRLPGVSADERWARSVYIDQTPRLITVRLSDVQPVGFSPTRRPIVARVRSLLFVLAWPTTAPGARGAIRLTDVRLVRTGDAEMSGANGQQQIQGAGQEQQVRRPGRDGGRQ